MRTTVTWEVYKGHRDMKFEYLSCLLLCMILPEEESLFGHLS